MKTCMLLIGEDRVCGKSAKHSLKDEHGRDAWLCDEHWESWPVELTEEGKRYYGKP